MSEQVEIVGQVMLQPTPTAGTIIVGFTYKDIRYYVLEIDPNIADPTFPFCIARETDMTHARRPKVNR